VTEPVHHQIVVDLEDSLGGRRLRYLLGALTLVLVVGCALQLTPQQALVEEAFGVCHAQGPSTKLERVERDGRFTVVGREHESQRVHDCMVRYAEPTRRPAPATAPPASAPPSSAPPAPKAEPLVASRLPGTWRGTLKLPPRAAGEVEVASPALLRFAVAAGSIRWSLASGTAAVPLAADGTAIVVDGELRMTGTVRMESIGSNAGVRYAGTMVGDRLEVTGVTTDKQVHNLSVRRTAE
jgi:hypothetical protein